MGLMGTFYSGIKANSLDIAPNYAGKSRNYIFFARYLLPFISNPCDLMHLYHIQGVIMAIANGTGSLAGVIGPYIVALLTPNVSGIFQSLMRCCIQSKIINFFCILIVCSHI